MVSRLCLDLAQYILVMREKELSITLLCQSESVIRLLRRR